MEPALSSTILKFPLFLPASWQEKSVGISKLLMIRLVPSFKLKTKYLYLSLFIYRILIFTDFRPLSFSEGLVSGSYTFITFHFGTLCIYFHVETDVNVKFRELGIYIKLVSRKDIFADR